MENTGVTCDVCECRHNVQNCKCDLPQIKVTEHCSCTTQQDPALLPELRKEIICNGRKLPAQRPRQGMSGEFLCAVQWMTTLQVARLRTSVPTLSFIWMPAKPRRKAACTFSSRSSMKTLSPALSWYLSSRAL